MRAADEPNLEILRKKATVLESENERMSKKLVELLRENLELKGMSPQAIEQNLPGLLDQVTTKPSASGATRSGNEGRPRGEGKDKSKDEPQKGHGPTPQPGLETIEETFDVDEADKICPLCGLSTEEWEGAEDESEIIESIHRKWVKRKCLQKKHRCKCGGCVITAPGPDKLIKGGRYGIGVAVDSAIAKYEDSIPLSRQVKMAKREGVKLTTQTLWDQILALAIVLAPLCERIKRHILDEPVIGTDLTGFSLIEKGGSKKKQVWQLSCPTAIYFEMLDSKRADDGEKLFKIMDGEEELFCFAGIAMMDGAPELLAIANKLGFNTAGCWSHGRRNVIKADKEAPGQVAEFLDLVGELYEIDRKAARDPPSEDNRPGYRHRLDLEKLAKLRDTESREVCDRIHMWILEQSCVPGGLLKAGLKYIAGRWTRLLRFLDDPRIPLDNNRTEASFIGLAQGRRNYIGARSDRGMMVAARFYTVVESARVNGIDGLAYLRYAAITACRGGDPVLPHEWSPGS